MDARSERRWQNSRGNRKIRFWSERLSHFSTTMMRSTQISVVLGLLIITTERLPAPIVEETTPPPKAKVKRTAAETEAKPKPSTTTKSASPAKVSFAGTWTGSASGRINQAVFGQTSFSSNYKIQIAPDERSASWTSSAWIFARFQAPVQKNGRTLMWTTERHDLAGTTTVNCRLEMDANGTARYSESSGLVNGVFKGAGYELSGVVVRQ